MTTSMNKRAVNRSDPAVSRMKAAPTRTVFITMLFGGSAALGAEPFHDLWLADGAQVPVFLALIDTDPANDRLCQDGIVDAVLPLDLKPAQLAALKGSPRSFGPTVQRIVAQVAPLLQKEQDCRNGARTTRCLAQLAFCVHRDAFAARLNGWIRAIKHRWSCDSIVPVLVGSSGGGTGSALILLVAQALMQTQFRSAVLQGLEPGLLLPPVVFACEPFYRTYAHSLDPIHTSKILANAFAFRVETAYLEQIGGIEYSYHLGLSSAGGAVLDSERDVARVLGTSIFQYEKHWATHIKPRLVDTADTHAMFGRYRGDDIPENTPLPPPPDRTPATPRNGQRTAP